MLYRFDGRKVLAHGLEFSVANHCNLPCAGCSHLSPYQDKRFPSFESFSAALEGSARSFMSRNSGSSAGNLF